MPEIKTEDNPEDFYEQHFIDEDDLVDEVKEEERMGLDEEIKAEMGTIIVSGG